MINKFGLFDRFFFCSLLPLSSIWCAHTIMSISEIRGEWRYELLSFIHYSNHDSCRKFVFTLKASMDEFNSFGNDSVLVIFLP